MALEALIKLAGNLLLLFGALIFGALIELRRINPVRSDGAILHLH